MRFSTIFSACVLIVFTGFSLRASAQCAEGGDTKYYCNEILGEGDAFGEWTASNYGLLFELDAEKLTDASYPKTGALDGENENLNYKTNVPINPLGSGVIPVTLYDYDENGDQHDSGKKFNIKYHNCVFAPDHYTSSYTKVNRIPSDVGKVSGCGTGGGPCIRNDNSIFIRSVYSKKGFIELNRQASTEAEGSKHGYIQLDNLRGVERVQWSFSSTAWKRGVVCEVKEGADGEWTRIRSLPSDVGNYATFSEQGYEFQEMIDRRGNPNKVVSIRFRIWDGDDSTWEEELDLSAGQRSPQFYYRTVDPIGMQQVARIHQIKVFSSLNGSEIATSVDSNEMSTLGIYKSGNSVFTTVDSDIEIYTIDGKLSKKSFGNQMNITDLNKGIYVVKAKSLDGTIKNIKISL